VEDQKVKLVFQADTAGVREANSALQQYLNTMEDVGEEAEDAEKKTKRIGGGFSGIGQSVMAASRGLDDFASQIQYSTQRAIQSTVNNVEQLALGLGAGAGLAGVATMAAVALSVLWPWLQKLFGGETENQSASQVEDLTTKIAALKEELKGDIKVGVKADELEELENRLKRLTKALEDYKAAATGQTREEQASGKAFGEIFASREGREEMQRQADRASIRQSAKLQGGIEDLVRRRDAVQQQLDQTDDHMEQLRLVSDKKDLEQRIASAQEFQRQAAKSAGERVASVYSNAVSGAGQAQADAQAEYVGLLDETGFGQQARQRARRVSVEGIREQEALKEEQERLKQQRQLDKQIEAAEQTRADKEAKAIADRQKATEKAMEEERQDSIDQEKTRRDAAEKAAKEAKAEAARNEAARLAEQAQAVQLQGEERDQGFAENRLRSDQRELMAAMRQAINQGANQFQMQQMFGDDMLRLQQQQADLEQRQESLRIRYQQARFTHQRRFGGN
jgi:hypothetical protein